MNKEVKNYNKELTKEYQERMKAAMAQPENQRKEKKGMLEKVVDFVKKVTTKVVNFVKKNRKETVADEEESCEKINDDPNEFEREHNERMKKIQATLRRCEKNIRKNKKKK